MRKMPLEKRVKIIALIREKYTQENSKVGVLPKSAL